MKFKGYDARGGGDYSQYLAIYEVGGRTIYVPMAQHLEAQTELKAEIDRGVPFDQIPANKHSSGNPRRVLLQTMGFDAGEIAGLVQAFKTISEFTEPGEITQVQALQVLRAQSTAIIALRDIMLKVLIG